MKLTANRNNSASKPTMAKKPGAIRQFASRALVYGMMLLPVLPACRGATSDESGQLAASVQAMVFPKTESVRQLADILKRADSGNFVVNETVEWANNLDAATVQLMVDLSSLMADLGMWGENIPTALSQILDPWPDRPGFLVGRGPTEEESARLGSLLERAGRVSGREGTGTYGFNYDDGSKRLAFTYSPESQQ